MLVRRREGPGLSSRIPGVRANASAKQSGADRALRYAARGEACKETAARPHQAGRSSAGALRRTGIRLWAPPYNLEGPRGQRLLRSCRAWGDRRIRWSRAEVVGVADPSGAGLRFQCSPLEI